jgi:maltooligosyltrehalose trehalohydrolase
MAKRGHGPEITRDGVRFNVWAPGARRLAVRANDRDHPLVAESDGWHSAEVAGAAHGTRYQFVLEDGRLRPDPAARRQPEDVHGVSQVFDSARHAWRSEFRGLPLEALVFYELHLGTFTPEGTLDAAAERLPALAELGFTCVELLPVQPFPGERNWGYDGVLPYGVHERYGGPEALQRFVDRAHALGLAVCLDVVYNHLGPEGNYLRDFGPYFTARHRSPWGDGINFDGEGADGVRSFFLGAAVSWVRDFRIDALRLDATHAIADDSPRHFVGALCDAVFEVGRRTGRHVEVVAENDENERGVLDPPPQGWGCSAVWADDLHHAIHALVTGERGQFFADYGAAGDVARALAEGFVYQGQVSPFRKKPHGTDPRGLAPPRFVTCAQNHDQVGNRPLGDRLSTIVPFEALTPIATLVLLGGGTPLVFMGEEYGETRPFQYFTSHSDPALAKAVSEGRKKELIAALGPGVRVPDPQDPETFLRSKLAPRLDGGHGALRAHFATMLRLRRKHLERIAEAWPSVRVDRHAFVLSRPGLEVVANLGSEPAGGVPGYGWAVRES